MGERTLAAGSDDARVLSLQTLAEESVLRGPADSSRFPRRLSHKPRRSSSSCVFADEVAFPG